MSEKYTLADRKILRDGKPFVSIAPAVKDGGNEFAYWETDQFARFIPQAIEALRQIAANKIGGVQTLAASVAIGVLKQLEYKL